VSRFSPTNYTEIDPTPPPSTPPQLLAGKDNKKLNSGEQFLAGFGAGVLEAIFAVTPIETVKTKAIQTNAPFMQGVKTILKNEGPAGLYQGVWATIAKQGSNQVRAYVLSVVLLLGSIVQRRWPSDSSRASITYKVRVFSQFAFTERSGSTIEMHQARCEDKAKAGRFVPRETRLREPPPERC